MLSKNTSFITIIICGLNRNSSLTGLVQTYTKSLITELSADNVSPTISSLRIPCLNLNRLSQPIDALKFLSPPNYVFNSRSFS